MDSSRRSLYFLYATTFFIFLNFYVAQTITPLYILEVGGSEFFSGLQSTLFFLTAVILRFYFGPLADQKGNKLTLFIGGMAFATAPLLFLLSQEVWYILMIRAYQAIGLAAYFSSASSLASALAPREKLGRYIGFYRLVTMSTLMIGPSLAMKVINSYGYQNYHLLGILVGIIALSLLYFVKEPKAIEQSPNLLPRYNMLLLLREKTLRPIYISIFFVSIVYGLLLTFSAIYIERTAPEINSGIFFTLFGIGSVVSNLIAGGLSDRHGRAKVAFPCMLIMGIGVCLLYFLPAQHGIIYIGSIIAGLGYAGGISVLISWIIDSVKPERRTTALALQDSSIDIGIASGSFIYGILIPLVGMNWAYGLSGFGLALFALRRIRQTPKAVLLKSKS